MENPQIGGKEWPTVMIYGERKKRRNLEIHGFHPTPMIWKRAVDKSKCHGVEQKKKHEWTIVKFDTILNLRQANT